MASVFPALKGKMGEIEYIATTMKLAEVNRFIQYAETVQDWEIVPPDLRAQRRLNLSRVRNEMVPYLIDNTDHFFSAITVELRRPDGSGSIEFKTSESDSNIGQLILDGTEVLMCVDGQHRLKAIELALDIDPMLASESITVIVVPHQNIKQSQQLFSDLNRYAKQPTKTLNILYSHRDYLARLAKAVADESNYLRGRVNMESNTLGRNNPQVITLGVLYECMAVLCDKAIVNDQAQVEEELKKDTQAITHIYDHIVFPALARAAPEVDQVANGQTPAHILRTRYIFAHSVGQQAIAHAVRAAQTQHPDDWETITKNGLSKIDWRIGLKWEGVATMAGTLANRRQNIARTAALIKAWLGLKLSEGEEKDLITAKHSSGLPDWSLPEPLVSVHIEVQRVAP